MVIGGQAVLIHGESRLTRDIDITLAVDTDRLPDVLALVKGLKLRLLINNPQEFVPKTKVLPAVQRSTEIRVDFIFSSSEFEREAIKRAKAVRVERATVKFASLEDLIIHKIIAGRPRDLEDVKILLIKNPNYDAAHIKSWLRKFDKALDADYSKIFANIQKEPL